MSLYKFKFGVLGVLLSILFGLSATLVNAASVGPVEYNRLTVNEKIAYIYGQITQIQAIINLRQNGGEDYSNVVFVSSNSSLSKDVDVETLSAINIENDEADLRGRFDLDDEKSATVWFEYGVDDDDLDDDTPRRKVTDSRGEVQTFSANVDDLREDRKYYYRAVIEDRNRDRSYGKIRSFTTDDDRQGSSRDFGLELSDDFFEKGDEVEVDWEIPSRDEGPRNWIGLYEPRDSNNEYKQWKYLENDNRGTMKFTIYREGKYEFRLFLDNSYSDEETSEEFEVD